MSQLDFFQPPLPLRSRRAPAVRNGATGRFLKEVGMQTALENSGDWSARILDEAREWIKTEKARGTKRVTIEFFRASARSQPHSHKAWGSLPRLLCKAGLIEPAINSDGQRVYQPAAAPKTHAHPVAVWTVL